MRLAPTTIRNTVDRIKRFLRNSHEAVSYGTISDHLKTYLNHAPATYNAELKALRRLMKYLNQNDLMESFKMAPIDNLSYISEPPTRKQIRLGFEVQTGALAKAVYLFLATSGLRKSEFLSLEREHVNMKNCSVKANHYTRNKRSGITFFNKEAEAWLIQYLEERTDDDPRVFIISDRQWRMIWNRASEAAGTRITSKKLRLWHSTELGELGVPDRYVDIFQGRAPRSVLAKHYTGNGLERLKRIYDKAGLKVLS